MSSSDRTDDTDVFAPFARQRLIDWWDQSRLAGARVLVVGAGALGNEVLKNLALVGVGHIYIIDFDVIEPSNLSRAVLFRGSDTGQGLKARIAAERVAQINPYSEASVAYFHGDLVWELGAGVYRGVDVVLGCLDNVEARRCVNFFAYKVATPWIDGAINKLSGSVSFFTGVEDEACYECGMTAQMRRMADERYSCMSGTVRSKILSGHEPTTQTTSAIVAAIQAQEAIKVCHSMPIPGGRKLYYNGLLHNFDPAEPSVTTLTDLHRDDLCFCHQDGRFSDVIVADLSNRSSVADLLAYARQSLGFSAPTLQMGPHPSALGRNFVVAATCGTCGYQTSVGRPAYKVHDTDVICPQCTFVCPNCQHESTGEPVCPRCKQVDRPTMRLSRLHTLDAESPYASMSLGDLGLPNLDIVVLAEEGHSQYVQIGSSLDLIFTRV